MIYAEFHHPSTGWNGKDFSGPVVLIPACGSDSVRVLDGRWRRDRIIAEARRTCTARGYNGFSLHAGETFTRSQEVRPLEVVKPLPEQAA